MSRVQTICRVCRGPFITRDRTDDRCRACASLAAAGSTTSIRAHGAGAGYAAAVAGIGRAAALAAAGTGAFGRAATRFGDLREESPPEGWWRIRFEDHWGERGHIDAKSLVWGLGRSVGDVGSLATGGDDGRDEARLDMALHFRPRVDSVEDVGEIFSKIHGVPAAQGIRQVRGVYFETAPIPNDLLEEKLMLVEGNWQIVCGPDVRIVQHGHCPATHLPAYAVGTREAAERLVSQSTTMGYDGSTRIAPELAYDLTIENLRRYHDRLDAMHRGAWDEIEMPDFEEQTRQARARARREAKPLSLEPLDPQPESLEETIYRRQGGFRVVTHEDFVQWAGLRGMNDPVALKKACFPGCIRADSYSSGWFAIWYPDHVRLGRLENVPPASRPITDAEAALLNVIRELDDEVLRNAYGIDYDCGAPLDEAIGRVRAQGGKLE